MTATCRVERVSKRYGRRLCLDEVTVTLHAGQIVGLVGPNGAGKTTLLRIVAGLLRPSSGEVRHVGADGSPTIRYFAGEQTLPPHVLTHHWMSLWSLSGVARSKAVERRRLGMLSRGTRQRVGLQAILSGPVPRLLLLDEPWEGLDPDASRWLSSELVAKREGGATVWVSSHRIHDLAEICDSCAFLVDGRLTIPRINGLEHAASLERSARLFAAFDEARGARR